MGTAALVLPLVPFLLATAVSFFLGLTAPLFFKGTGLPAFAPQPRVNSLILDKRCVHHGGMQKDETEKDTEDVGAKNLAAREAT